MFGVFTIPVGRFTVSIIKGIPPIPIIIRDSREDIQVNDLNLAVDMSEIYHLTGTMFSRKDLTASLKS